MNPMEKTEWHPAFCAAMRLELKDNPTLELHDEYNLNVDPLRVDLLIIHKPSDVKIDNQIGEFFEENNIPEYKSHFNLLKWFNRQGIRYSKRYQGIYDISDLQFIKCQVIITEEIDNDNFKWLSALTDKLTEAKARDVISTAYAMPQGENKRLAEAVVLAMHDANSKLFEKIKEDQTMASSLFELMRPEIDKYAENREKDIYMTQAKIMLQHGSDNDYIKLLTHLSDEDINVLRKNMA